MQLSQSEALLAAIFVGFMLYLAAKGKLRAYWSLLVGGGSGAAPASVPGVANPAPQAGGPSLPSSAAPSPGTPPIVPSPLPSGSGAPPTGTVTGTVTGSGQSTGQLWPFLPGTLPPLPSVSF